MLRCKKIFEVLWQDSFSPVCTSSASVGAVSSRGARFWLRTREKDSSRHWPLGLTHLLGPSAPQLCVGLQTVASTEGCRGKAAGFSALDTERKSEYKGDISCLDLSWWLLPVLVHQRVCLPQGRDGAWSCDFSWNWRWWNCTRKDPMLLILGANVLLFTRCRNTRGSEGFPDGWWWCDVTW